MDFLTLGEAESQIPVIHRFCAYDISLDSTSKNPASLATEIADFLKAGTPFVAMKKMEAVLLQTVQDSN